MKNLTVKTGPNDLFDINEIRNADTLEIRIISDEILESSLRPGKQIQHIVAAFKSQDWHGFEWTHQVWLYLPVDCENRNRVGIIGAKWQDFEDGADLEYIADTGMRTFDEYGEGTALDLGIPVMAFSVPGENINGMNESDLTGWSMSQMLATGDYTWYAYYPITKAYLRAITLAGSLLGTPDIKAVLLGCSKRGAAVSLATGIDPNRVAGIMTTCYPGGNSLYLAALKFAHFGPGIGGPSEERLGPGFLPADVLLKILNNPIGLTSIALYDPYIWRDRIRSRFLIAIGTNDEFFGLGTEHGMMDDFGGQASFLAIDNLIHTWVSEKHLAAWRMWLTHCFDQRPIPQVSVLFRETAESLTVTATVESDIQISEVTAYFAYNDTSDWRCAIWQSQEMSTENDSYATVITKAASKKLAFYVEVKDEQGGLASSTIQFATQ